MLSKIMYLNSQEGQHDKEVEMLVFIFSILVFVSRAHVVEHILRSTALIKKQNSRIAQFTNSEF